VLQSGLEVFTGFGERPCSCRTQPRPLLASVTFVTGRMPPGVEYF
jgi:hypothetical protein